MVTLRCTQRLLRRLGTPAEGSAPPSTTVLGDWYANLYYTRPQQMVLCVNERTMLAVVVTARDAGSLGARFRDRAVRLLAQLGVAPAAVEREARAMEEIVIAPTASRRVLGCLNEAAYTIEMELALGRRTEAAALELYLSENIYSLTGHRHPRELVLELLAARGDA